MPQASKKLWVDSNLAITASRFDNLTATKRGMHLFYSLGPKLNEVLSILDEIVHCYGCDCNAPIGVGMIRDMMTRYIIPNMNLELSKLKLEDRSTLEKELTERMELLEKSKEKRQEIRNMYKTMTLGITKKLQVLKSRWPRSDPGPGGLFL